MINRRRNFAILGVLVALLVLALGVILPGSPISKDTKLGLDLQGGVELVYQGKDPKGGEIEPQQIDDAIETIRKRTDALGVSEPEIQRSGSDQITVGLPDVDNAERAEQQVGTTAQLQFYDWEPNIITEEGQPQGSDPLVAGSEVPQPSLYDAVKLASKAQPRAESDDLPPTDYDPVREEVERVQRDLGGDQQAIYEHWDRQNDTGTEKYYLFGPGEGEGRPFLAGPDSACAELLAEYEEEAPPAGQRGKRRPAPKEGDQCAPELRALGTHGPPAGSEILKVPRGIVVLRADEESIPEAERSQPVERQPHFAFEDDAELSGDQVENPEQNFDQRTNQPIVSFELDDRGKAAFQDVTQEIADRGQELISQGVPPENAAQRFAISLDNELISIASVDPQEFGGTGIDPENGAQIEGIGSLEETQDLAENLRIGALPIELDLISRTQVSATLGEQALRQGLLAGLAGVVLTILFLLAFYRALGVVATLALLFYGILLFALIKLIPITLTLPGIAGTVLTLAVAADANIVMYERIKEEARTGLSVPRAIASGYSKALKTIIDANVVTIGVAFILFMLATAGVKGFAFTLGVGTLVSLFTAVLATSAILGSLARTRFLSSHWARKALGATGEEHKPWRFDFHGAGKWFFSTSGVIVAAGAIAIAGLGLNFGIDFESGTRIQTPLEQAASVDEVRDSLEAVGLDNPEVQEVEDPELGANVIQISTSTLEPAEVQRVQDQLDEDFGVRGADFSANSIGPTFGEQIARTAVIAVIASLFLIALYIGLRFEFKFAVPVLIALAHDLLITAGVYALADREVTTSTVAALLTILGYSLYDTIIVFDRIRENVPRMPRATFSQIVNRSMSEVLTRSLVTSFSAGVPVLGLMLFGGETLQDFGFALLIGVLSGTYSSIFIAAPVLTEWKEREPLYRRRRQVVLEDHGGVVPPYPEAALGRAGAGPATAPVPAGATATPASAAAAASERRRARAASRGGAQVNPRLGAAAEAAEEAEKKRPGDGGASRSSSTGGSQVRRTPDASDGAPDGGDGGRETAPAGGSKKRKQGSTRKGRKKHGRR